MQIRPHHILCIGNYVGHGYSEEFTANMDVISKRVKVGEPFVLTEGADDLCSACPFCSDGQCTTKEKTDRYDKAVIGIYGLEYGREYTYEEFDKPGVFYNVCSDCEWFELCKKVDRDK